MAYRYWCRHLMAVSRSSHGPTGELVGGSSRDREVRLDRLELWKLVKNLKSSSAVTFGVPLLSQEGPTCRLLPGAAAPFPALDQELTSTAAPADDFVVVFVDVDEKGS